MDNNLRRTFKASIITINGSEFHNFVSRLFLLHFGVNFDSVKQKRDRGCDGIIDRKKIVAVYGPSIVNKNLKEFKKKSSADYDKYKQNWEKDYNDWCFVYNGECTADRINHLRNLKADVIIYDLNQILEMISKLSFPKFRELANLLGISIEYYRNDILKQITEDLIKTPKINVDYSIRNPKDIEEKIKKNYDKEDHSLIRKKHEIAFTDIEALKVLLKAYDDTDISAMKMRILDLFERFEGNFKEKMKIVKEVLCDEYKNSKFNYFVEVILLYLFESCIIGENP